MMAAGDSTPPRASASPPVQRKSNVLAHPSSALAQDSPVATVAIPLTAPKIAPAVVPATDVEPATQFPAWDAFMREAAGRCVLVDGGLATELERRGADLNDPLWSAKCLLDDTQAALIREVHADYFSSGADICISASYQATIQGFLSRGFSQTQAEELLRRSVQLVGEARDLFWSRAAALNTDQHAAVNSIAADSTYAHSHALPGPLISKSLLSSSPFATTLAHSLSLDQRPLGHDGWRQRQRPLVAASVGSYGAFLADGSEYSGDYGAGIGLAELVAFHTPRIEVLAHSGADLLALETIPSLLEAQALVRVLEALDTPIPAWISFNSKDGRRTVRGDAFEECVAAAVASPKVVAVGINCTPPRYIHSLVTIAKKHGKGKPIVVYPNSGETWDGVNKVWVDSSHSVDDDFVSFAPEWVRAGASILGGCCRTTPNTVRSMARALYPREGEGEEGEERQAEISSSHGLHAAAAKSVVDVPVAFARNGSAEKGGEHSWTNADPPAPAAAASS